jgi:hypothetical protein
MTKRRTRSQSNVENERAARARRPRQKASQEVTTTTLDLPQPTGPYERLLRKIDDANNVDKRG